MLVLKLPWLLKELSENWQRRIPNRLLYQTVPFLAGAIKRCWLDKGESVKTGMKPPYGTRWAYRIRRGQEKTISRHNTIEIWARNTRNALNKYRHILEKNIYTSISLNGDKSTFYVIKYLLMCFALPSFFAYDVLYVIWNFG